MRDVSVFVYNSKGGAGMRCSCARLQFEGRYRYAMFLHTLVTQRRYNFDFAKITGVRFPYNVNTKVRLDGPCNLV